jgi:hypothetical protein
VEQQAYARDVALTPLFFLLVGIGLFVFGANRRMAARTELPSYSGGLPALRSHENTGKLPMRVGAASAGLGVFLFLLSTIIHLVLFVGTVALIVGAVILVVRFAGLVGRKA